MKPKPLSTHLDVYNLIQEMDTVGARFGRGTQSTITNLGDGWILKEDARGAVPQTEWERSVYELIEGIGLAPECDLAENQLIIRMINAAASLEDYATAFAVQGYPKSIWVDLCRDVGEIIARFHRAGFVHGDLHLGNIVVGLENRCTLRPLLIDFGTTQHPDLEEYPHELTIDPSEDADLNRLDESLRAICQDPHFLDGLAEIALAYARN